MRRSLLAALALVFVLPLLAVACGEAETVSPAPETVEGEIAERELPEGDAQAGKPIFAESGCGGCHVLEAAGTSGTAGPNLDESKPDYREAFVQIENGGGGMPAYKDQLSEEQIANVAAFVVESSGGQAGG